MVQYSYAARDNVVFPEDSESILLIPGKPVLRIRRREPHDNNTALGMLHITGLYKRIRKSN